MSNKSFIFAIFIVVLINMIVFLEFNRTQIASIFQDADNLSSSVEDELEEAFIMVEYLHLSAVDMMKDKDSLALKRSLLIKNIDKNGIYALDEYKNKKVKLNDKVNLLGYSNSYKNKELMQEIEAALRLAPYFKLVKKNNDYAWVYYFSKNHFTVLYPYISSKDFHFSKKLEEKPFFKYATPKLNPNAQLFSTPLYKDYIGKGLMLTIGKPVYYKDEFLGTIDLDITLNKFDNILSKLDYLNNKSIMYNKYDQIMASNNVILNFDRGRIYKVNNFISSEILSLQNSSATLKYVDSKYVFVKKNSHLEFNFIYIVDAYVVWFKSLLYTFPIFLLMLSIVYLVYLYKKSKRLNQKLKLQTIEDYMTGAYNRRYFFEVAEAIFSKAKRKNSKIAVVMIDIDDFKAINDTYGHDIGDIAIIEVKKILEKNLRRYDLFARFGGEEFCVLLDDISKEDVEKLFEKIRKEFEENEISKENITFSYTVSFGIVYGLLDSLHSMIKLADEAVYKSKEEGKNRVSLYEV